MVIDLSGEWRFSLDPGNKGISELWATKTLNDFVRLPGTTDENKKGNLNSDKKETTHLSREYSWFGKAWYQRKVLIDKTWGGKNIQLVMERTKPTQVWVDGVSAGTNTDITTSQVYDLSQLMTVGQHTLTIMVDNGKSVPDEVISSSYAYVEHTQTNWNGIIGKLLLKAVDLCHIADVQSYPDIASHSVNVKLKIVNKSSDTKRSEISLNAEVWNTTITRKPVSKSFKVSLKPGDNMLEFVLDLGPGAPLWDEFHPDMYRLNVVLNSDNHAIDEASTNFGLRKFSTSGSQFVINGHPTFLRGKHDACMFPLIAHAAMDTGSWIRYFNICKSWGINHVRFHSWCPPEAAFEAADLVGIYLQPELPYWGNEDARKTVLIEFLRKEGLNIQKTYSNHPSFVMFAYGSNNYLGFKGPVDGEDYLTTCRIGAEKPNTFDTHVRASFSFADAWQGGYISGSYPNTVMDYSGVIKKSAVPVISHETGQFQTYPDYNDLQDFQGRELRLSGCSMLLWTIRGLFNLTSFGNFATMLCHC